MVGRTGTVSIDRDSKQRTSDLVLSKSNRNLNPFLRREKPGREINSATLPDLCRLLYP